MRNGRNESDGRKSASVPAFSVLFSWVLAEEGNAASSASNYPPPTFCLSMGLLLLLLIDAPPRLSAPPTHTHTHTVPTKERPGSISSWAVEHDAIACIAAITFSFRLLAGALSLYYSRSLLYSPPSAKVIHCENTLLRRRL
jgi:hypothetical protein